MVEAGSFGAPLLFGACRRAAISVIVLRGLEFGCVVGGGFLTYWYYYLPDYALAVLLYTLLGRALLNLFVEPDSSNYIWRFFCRLTDPFVDIVALVSPRAAAPIVLWLFGVVWLFWLRVLLLLSLSVLGLLPRSGG
jgi:hypothetical protein